MAHPFAGPLTQQVLDALRCAGAALGAANVGQGLFLVLRWNAERISRERILAMASLTVFSAVAAGAAIMDLGHPLAWFVPARLAAQVLAAVALYHFIRQPTEDIKAKDRVLRMLESAEKEEHGHARERYRDQMLDLIEERLTSAGAPPFRD